MTSGIPPLPKPIDSLTSFETTSDAELRKCVADQIEYTATELIMNYKRPDFGAFKDIIVEDIMRAFVGRRYIDPKFEWEWYTSYHIEDKPTGCDVVWTTDKGSIMRQEFSVRTGLLHAVGRNMLHQQPGVALYKRGRYELHQHRANFMMNKDY